MKHLDLKKIAASSPDEIIALICDKHGINVMDFTEKELAIMRSNIRVHTENLKLRGICADAFGGWKK